MSKNKKWKAKLAALLGGRNLDERDECDAITLSTSVRAIDDAAAARLGAWIFGNGPPPSRSELQKVCALLDLEDATAPILTNVPVSHTSEWHEAFAAAFDRAADRLSV